MSKKQTYWIQAYQEVLESRKQAPDFKLIEWLHIIPKGPVLDLGMGRGRHALFFAKLGRKVEGVDTATLSKGLPKAVDVEDLDFTYHRMDVREFQILPGKYALIIASRIIQLFRRADIENLAKKIQAGLRPKGVLYVSTLSAEDLQYFNKWNEVEKVEENTYHYAKYNLDFHFFTKHELLDLFPELKIQNYTEELRFNRRSDISRLTGIIQYVGQKTTYSRNDRKHHGIS
jgi:tellurite methyltransferase